MAEKEAAAKAAEEKALAEKEAAENDPNRRVRIKLFKDNDKYKEPLFVSVNEYRAVIPRGIDVDIPYFVAKHIEEMQDQDQHTATMIAMLTSDYDGKKDQLN